MGRRVDGPLQRNPVWNVKSHCVQILHGKSQSCNDIVTLCVPGESLVFSRLLSSSFVFLHFLLFKKGQQTLARYKQRKHLCCVLICLHACYEFAKHSLSLNIFAKHFSKGNLLLILTSPECDPACSEDKDP